MKWSWLRVKRGKRRRILWKLWKFLDCDDSYFPNRHANCKIMKWNLKLKHNYSLYIKTRRNKKDSLSQICFDQLDFKINVINLLRLFRKKNMLSGSDIILISAWLSSVYACLCGWRMRQWNKERECLNPPIYKWTQLTQNNFFKF